MLEWHYRNLGCASVSVTSFCHFLLRHLYLKMLVWGVLLLCITTRVIQSNICTHTFNDFIENARYMLVCKKLHWLAKVPSNPIKLKAIGLAHRSLRCLSCTKPNTTPSATISMEFVWKRKSHACISTVISTEQHTCNNYLKISA